VSQSLPGSDPLGRVVGQEASEEVDAFVGEVGETSPEQREGLVRELDRGCAWKRLHALKDGNEKTDWEHGDDAEKSLKGLL